MIYIYMNNDVVSNVFLIISVLEKNAQVYLFFL